MATGIVGATITTFTDGTIADGPSVSNNDLSLQTNGIDNCGGLIQTDGAGGLTVVKIVLTHGSITRISSFSGTGTVSNAAHGLGTTPDSIMITYAGNFGTPPTHPAYWYGATTTTVNIVADSSYFWWAWAIKF